MNFKHWLILSEAIDANIKTLLAKQKAPKDELNAFIKELEDEPNLIDRPTAFQRFQNKFNIQKKVTAEDAQRKYFANIPNTTEEELKTYDYYKTENKDSLKKMMEQLRKFIDKKLITIKIENNIPNLYRNNQKLDTPDFSRFTSQLDSIQAEITKYSGKGNKPNPLELELSHAEHRVAKGDNIWVFKGHRPNICRILGKNQRWCISSGTSAAHWFSYRIRHHQTQYFVFDFNKDENDPARYVNPGVAPEGMYSEWVDAENKHSTDPDARGDRSHVGINGYKSINEYKKYLKSKGIPLNTWTTTPPEDWEIRLHRYYELNQEEDSVNGHKSFASAKNDEHPEIFDMYLKIANTMKDYDFKTLTDEQKKEFLLSKITNITQKQFTYAIENFKGEYYNSLDLNDRIQFAGKTNDQEKLLKLAENPELDGRNVRVLLSYSDDKTKMAEIIIENISELSEEIINYLLKNYIAASSISASEIYASYTEIEKIAELIVNKRSDILSDKDVHWLLYKATDFKSPDKDKIAKLIIQNKPELNDDNVKDLLAYSEVKDEIAKLIIKKKPKLSDRDISNLIYYSEEKNKDGIKKLILKKQPIFLAGNSRSLA